MGARLARAGERMDRRKRARRRGSRFAGSRALRRPPQLPRLAVIEIDGVALSRPAARAESRTAAPVRATSSRKSGRLLPYQEIIESKPRSRSTTSSECSNPSRSSPTDHNGLRGIGKARQRHILFRAPDFRIIPRAASFQRRQAHDEIADGAWPDQKAPNQMCQMSPKVNHQL